MKYLTSTKKIQNSGNPTAKIWIVGESPGNEEIKKGKPFMGKSGDKLRQVLSAHGITYDKCFVTNLCPYQPVKNDFTNLLDNTPKELKKISSLAHLKPKPELKEGIKTLFDLIREHKPDIILALGAYPTSILTNTWHSITKSRGSVYECFPRKETKILASFHPAYILRNPSAFSAFDADIYKLSRYASGKVQPLQMDLIINPTQEHIDDYLTQPYLAVDIETLKITPKTVGMTKIRCISFAKSRHHSICIELDGSARHDDWIRQLLTCTAKKIFHNGSAFDIVMLELNRFVVNNFTDDTMIQSHVLYPELPKDLAFLTSIYTDMPYYKDEGKEKDAKGWSMRKSIEDLKIYNCKDTIATYWVWEELKELIAEREDDKRIYEYEIELANALIPLAHLGMKRDPERNKILKVALEAKLAKQYAIIGVILNQAEFNPNSPKQVQFVLYEHFKFPIQYKNAKGKKSVTSDNDALVKLLGMAIDRQDLSPLWKIKLKFIEAMLKIREYEKMLSSQINVIPSREGRVRGVYNAAGTESGRLSSSKYVDGTGMNMQTITRGVVET